MNDYRKLLNEVQYQAVTYLGGPELVIAGAGSGKTRVLTHKIAYLLEKDYPARRILALTYTKKAANEMLERINSLTDSRLSAGLVIGTFHSIFSKILRYEIRNGTCRDVLPYKPNFTIYDTDDSKGIIKGIVEDLGLDPKVYDASLIDRKISTAKNNMITPDQYTNTDYFARDTKNGLTQIHEVYKKYRITLRNSNAMDFDDLLMNTYLLFTHNEERRKRYAEHFQYILVDEYQDTNRIQKNILIQLLNEKNNICVVGDDAQSIYSFRGAEIENILGFTEDIPGTVVFKLQENYRSTQTLVNAANSVIKKNKRQIFKKLFSKKTLGEPLDFFYGTNEKNEASWVANAIQNEVRKKGRSYNDFAILYRSNKLSRSFEEELKKENINYRIVGGMAFYERKEIKDLLAYFRVVVNQDDTQAIQRIINFPARGIGQTTLNKLTERTAAMNKSIWEIISCPWHIQNILPKKTVQKIVGFVSLIRAWKNDLPTTDVYQMADRIFRESDIESFLKSSQKQEDLNRLDNIYELMSAVKEFSDKAKKEGKTVTLNDFLMDVALAEEITAKQEDTDNYVRMMTVHGSKGLEFPVVFVVGLDENIFPSHKVLVDGTEKDLEEERRLFYVAITRAKEKCCLTRAENRFYNGKNVHYQYSRFIDDIDAQYIQKV